MLLITLSGCGVRTAYNQLDWLTLRWVNQQVDLNADQSERLSEWLDEQLVWHCATQLPEYQAWLEEVHMDLLAWRLDRDRLEAHGQTAARFGRVLADRLVPQLVELAASLDEIQVEEVLTAFDERTETIREAIETSSLEELAEERLESMERNLRRLMGRLNSDQRERLATWAQSITATEPHQLRQRLYWQGRLAEALDQRDNRMFLTIELTALLQPASAWSDEYREVMEGNRQLTLSALDDVLSLADERHRTRLSARLQRLQRDFDRLRCEGEAPPEVLAAADSV